MIPVHGHRWENSIHRLWRKIITSGLLLATLAVGGCSDNEDPPVAPTPDIEFWSATPLYPDAATWKTWVIEPPTALRPGAPPSRETTESELTTVISRTASRTADQEAAIDFWNDGVSRQWNNLQRFLISSTSTNPPRASRGLALVSVALNDALVASWDAKFAYNRARPTQYSSTIDVHGPRTETPSYVAERTALSVAAAKVLTYLFPTKADTIAALRQFAITADQYSGHHFQSDIDAAEVLGEIVANAVIARGNSDNSSAVFTGTIPVGPGMWVPTPPAFVANPLEPMAGTWKTWVIESGHAIRPPSPPAYGTTEFDAQVDEVWTVNQNLTPERLAIAQYWADGAGTQTPPGHWNEIALAYADSTNFTEPQVARMLALLGVVQADAFIACWDCKFQYWCVRPVTEVRARYDANWLPPIGTPPFPSYPSGHSTTSGAAGIVLASQFPEHAVTILNMSVEAMNSRLYGGIHFSFDDLTGMNLGAAIATQLLTQQSGSAQGLDILLKQQIDARAVTKLR